MKTKIVAAALVAGLVLIWLVLPRHQRFVVEDMSKPQTFTYRRYNVLSPTGISLDIKGEIRDGAANVVLRGCDERYSIYRNQYTRKVDDGLGGDYFQNEACIDYIPVRSPEGNLEFDISIN